MVWSFVLAFGSILGLWLVSRNTKIGWAWCIFMEVLWIAWSVWVAQWGFLVLCVCYLAVYLNNLRISVKEESR